MHLGEDVIAREQQITSGIPQHDMAARVPGGMKYPQREAGDIE